MEFFRRVARMLKWLPVLFTQLVGPEVIKSLARPEDAKLLPLPVVRDMAFGGLQEEFKIEAVVGGRTGRFHRLSGAYGRWCAAAWCLNGLLRLERRARVCREGLNSSLSLPDKAVHLLEQ